jgi:hypothetical protein
MPSSKEKSKGSKGRKTAAKAGKQLVNEEATTTNIEEQKGLLNSKMIGLNSVKKSWTLFGNLSISLEIVIIQY